MNKIHRTFRIDKHRDVELIDIAKKKRVTVSEMIRKIIYNYLKKPKIFRRHIN